VSEIFMFPAFKREWDRDRDRDRERDRNRVDTLHG
jgi:hypothetical protein